MMLWGVCAPALARRESGLSRQIWKRLKNPIRGIKFIVFSRLNELCIQCLSATQVQETIK
jgi:hypothetical protein